MGRMVLVCALAILVFTSVSQARTWYITPDGTGDAPTIQAGVDSASSGDEVVLADGTFTGDGNRDIDYRGKILTVRSESNDHEACIIDCQGSAAEYHRGFKITATGSVLEGITITNGFHHWGAALVVYHNDPARGQVLIMNCRFLDNHADIYGGAIESNQAGYGLYEISDCVFSGNSADGGGGAIYLRWHWNAYAPMEIDNCTFIDNQSYYGCLIYEWWQDDVLTTSAGNGSLQDAFTTFTNCTIAGNSGGILFWDGSKASMEPASDEPAPFQEYWYSMSNTIIAYNDLVRVFPFPAPFMTCVDIYGNSCGDWTYAGSDQYGIRGNFSACPAFCGYEAGDFHLCDGSHCAPGNHPDTTGCGLIGAWGVGCVCGPSRTESSAWGAIKAMYR